jgi:hypothetical protein
MLATGSQIDVALNQRAERHMVTLSLPKQAQFRAVGVRGERYL